MNVQLPHPVAAYLAAEKAKDADRLARCFGKNAVVYDEGKEHKGIDAIAAWYRNANAQYQYVVEPVDASVDGPTTVVHTRVTGNFPGGVADLRCTFEVAESHIKSLAITQ